MLQLPRRALDLRRPVVMGVLNRTPDSFSDGGRHLDLDSALRQAEKMLADGALILDIGGESTRPGAHPVAEAEEIDRVLPLVEALAARLDAVISVDTMKPAVMRAACAAGAALINDVNALRAPGALQVLVDSGAAVCLMHMRGEPRSMQQAPHYDDVVGEVYAFLRMRVDACVTAGIGRARLCVDPGFGFGKDLRHNLALLARLQHFASLGVPLLVGMSRKSMLGAVTGRPVGERQAAGVAAATLAALGGASIVRTHDVAATVDALKLVRAIREMEAGLSQR